MEKTLRKIGCCQLLLVISLVCTINIRRSASVNESTASLPNTCYVLSYPSTLQVDVHCNGQLPDFSRMNFSLSPYLYQLVLDTCNFQSVLKNAFQGLVGLHNLFLTCEGSEIIPELQFEDGLFQDLPKLSIIVLSGNNIKVLPDGIFCNIRSINKLFLRNNSIILPKHLGFGTNCSTSYCRNNIEILGLADNAITHVPNRAFCSLTNLIYLDLSHNDLRSIEEDAFYNLRALRNLDLSHNNLTSMPETTLKPLIGLYSLDLANNSKLNISGFLKHMPHLKGLFLPGIELESLEKDSFQGLYRVESLMLYGNRLHTIHEEVFEPLIGVVDVVNNETMLPACEEGAVDRLVFGGANSLLNENYAKVINITGLRYLNLDSNNFTSMPPIRKLFKLQAFSISKNQIEDLDDDNFQNLQQLQRLTLSFNRIRIISSRIFADLKCLKQLLLDHNSIGYINSTAFHGLTALSEVKLQHNRIKDIRDIFVKNENLKLLNLSHNYLEELSFETLPSNIEKLDVSHNFIKHLVHSPDSLLQHIHMQLLDLSNNAITTINKELFPRSVNNLYLHDNLIENISSCVFCSLSLIVNITLHNNQLKTMHPDDLRINSLPTSSKIPDITLIGNHFICNCQFQEMKDFKYKQSYLKIDNFEKLTCHREYNKNGPTEVLLAKTLSPEDFLCKVNHQNNASIPETCSVFYDFTGEYIIVDCSGGNLKSLPSYVYPGVIKLYLDGNNFEKLQNTVFQTHVHQNLTELYLNGSHIEFIEDNTFIMLVKLTLLHLKHNDLKYLSKDSFAGLQQLNELSLSYNNLMMMDGKIFYPLTHLRQLQLSNNQLRAFPIWELHNLKSLSSIRLSQNPWSCDCDYIQNYREWLQNWASAVMDLDSLFCKFDNKSTSGVPIIAFNASLCFHLNEPSFLKSKHFPLILGLITSLVLFTITSVILHIYRKEMQVLIYSRYGVRIFHKNNTQNVDGDKMYDAFICYSNTDEDFVIDELLPNLEGIEPPFRCCIHQRDFLVGGYITDNILEAVSKSRRSILVLSESFISSEWCRFEFKTAYVQMLKDKCNRVIVVVVGAIPKQLDPEMQLYLKTNTYISWGDKLFWERLYFAMPDRVQSQ